MATNQRDEAQDLAAIMRFLTLTEHWAEGQNEAHDVELVEPGSALAGDDRRTDPHHVSHAAWHALGVAIDHLHCLRIALQGCAEHEPAKINLHTYAPFTLTRASMENAATAIWLLAPASRSERICRRLRHESANIRANCAVRDLLEQPGPRAKDQRLDELRSAARSCQIDPKDAVKKPEIGEILAAAGEVVDIGGEYSTALWRACSGLAHGDMWATIAMLDREELRRVARNVSTYRITAPTNGLLATVMASVVMIHQGRELYDARRRNHLH